MTKLSLLIITLVLGVVACGGRIDRTSTNWITGDIGAPVDPWAPGAAGAPGDEPEQDPGVLTLVCPTGHVPNYISSALASAVDTLAAEGALIAIGCSSDVTVLVDMNPHRCAERAGAERSACIDEDGVHVNAELTPEHLAELVLEATLRQLLAGGDP